MTMIRAFDNDLIREVNLAHRVKSVHAVHGTGVTVLDCECGRQFRTAADPEAATRRLWKTHAIHVSTHLMTIGDDQ